MAVMTVIREVTALRRAVAEEVEAVSGWAAMGLEAKLESLAGRGGGWLGPLWSMQAL